MSSFLSSSSLSGGGVHNGTSPISHSSSVALQQREIVRIHELWQKAKSELRSKSQELSDLQQKTNILDSSSRRIHSQMEDTAQLQSQNLRMSERLKVLETDLDQSRNENDKWQLHSEHLTLQLRESEGRLGEATARYRQQSLRLQQFEGKVNEIEEEKREILTRSLADVRDHDEAVTLRNRKLMAQESRITLQEEVVGQLRGDLEDNTRKLLEAEQRAVRSERKCRAFESDVEASRSHLRDHVQTKRTIEALKFEIDHLKRDNGRMVRLLSTTDEYRDFQAQSQDSRGMTFVPKNLKKKSRVGSMRGAGSTKKSSAKSGNISKGSSKTGAPHFDKSLLGQEYGAWGDVEVFSKVYASTGAFRRHPIKSEEETKNWVPTDAVRLAFDFKQRHMQHVSMGMMNELLQQLNEIWRLREKRHVQRAKSRWVHQVKELKRQLQQRVPYAEVVQKVSFKFQKLKVAFFVVFCAVSRGLPLLPFSIFLLFFMSHVHLSGCVGSTFRCNHTLRTVTGVEDQLLAASSANRFDLCKSADPCHLKSHDV